MMFTLSHTNKSRALLVLAGLVIVVDSASYVMSVLSDLGLIALMYLVFALKEI